MQYTTTCFGLVSGPSQLFTLYYRLNTTGMTHLKDVPNFKLKYIVSCQSYNRELCYKMLNNSLPSFLAC